MPQIPTSQRQVRKEVISAPQRSVEGPSIAMGRPLEFQAANVIADAGDIIIKERMKAEQIELDAFKTKLRDKQNQLLHDPQQGFKTVRGKDTLEQTDKYEKEFTSYVDAEIKNFKSDRLKEMAGQIAEEGRVGLTNQFMQHTSRELEAHDDAQTEANIKSLRDSAVLNYQDPTPVTFIGEDGEAREVSQVEAAILEQKKQIKAYADRKGMSKEQADQMILNASSDVHKGIITQMITDDNDKLAEAYFKEARIANQITANDAIQIEKGIEQASLLGDAQRVTNVVMQNNMSRTDALDYARTKYAGDPKKQKATAEMINRRYDEKKRIESENQVKTFEGLSVGLEKGKTIEAIKKDPQWLEITHNQRKALELDAKQRAKGITPTTNLQVYEKVSMLAAHPKTRDKFLRMSLKEFQPYLSPGDYKKFVDMKKNMYGGDFSEAEGFLTRSQVVKSTMETMDIKGDEDQAKFNLELEKRATEWSENNGNRKIPTKELQNIAKTIANEVVLHDGWLYDTTEQVYKVTPAQVQNMEASDIPTKDYDQIVNTLNATGVPVTDEAILNEYLINKGLK